MLITFFFFTYTRFPRPHFSQCPKNVPLQIKFCIPRGSALWNTFLQHLQQQTVRYTLNKRIFYYRYVYIYIYYGIIFKHYARVPSAVWESTGENAELLNATPQNRVCAPLRRFNFRFFYFFFSSLTRLIKCVHFRSCCNNNTSFSGARALVRARIFAKRNEKF